MVDQIVLRKYLYQQTLSRLTVFWQTPPPSTREVTPALPHTHTYTHTCSLPLRNQSKKVKSQQQPLPAGCFFLIDENSRRLSTTVRLGRLK